MKDRVIFLHSFQTTAINAYLLKKVSPDSMNMKFAGLCIPNKNQLCSVNTPMRSQCSYRATRSWPPDTK